MTDTTQPQRIDKDNEGIIDLVMVHMHWIEIAASSISDGPSEIGRTFCVTESGLRIAVRAAIMAGIEMQRDYMLDSGYTQGGER